MFDIYFIILDDKWSKSRFITLVKEKLTFKSDKDKIKKWSWLFPGENLAPSTIIDNYIPTYSLDPSSEGKTKDKNVLKISSVIGIGN